MFTKMRLFQGLCSFLSLSKLNAPIPNAPGSFTSLVLMLTVRTVRIIKFQAPKAKPKSGTGGRRTRQNPPFVTRSLALMIISLSHRILLSSHPHGVRFVRGKKREKCLRRRDGSSWRTGEWVEFKDALKSGAPHILRVNQKISRCGGQKKEKDITEKWGWKWTMAFPRGAWWNTEWSIHSF